MSSNAAEQSALVRALSAVERVGQKLPDPLTLFFGMSALAVSYTHLTLPTSG
mgnify:CR=1 FL=1